MTPYSLDAPSKGAYFFLVIASFVGLSLTFTGSAHPVIFSEYSLEYKNEQWLLSFEQKTSYLRDALYASNPDLRGINLNSEDFLKATEKHIASIIRLTFRGNQLRIVPQQMKYGGLRFESTFLVEGLSPAPDYLTIHTDGFDTHEHSIIVFRVIAGKEGYLNHFNRDQRLATYDFATHHYAFGEIHNYAQNKLLLSGISLLILISVAMVLLRVKSWRARPAIH